MSMMEYYYSDEEGHSCGPIEESALRALHSSGALSDSTQACMAGSDEWCDVADLLCSVDEGDSLDAVGRPSEVSAWDRVKSAALGLLLFAFGINTLIKYLVNPITSGVFYGRRERFTTLQDQEPIWFWVQVFFRGGALSLAMISLGLVVLVFGLRGESVMESITVRGRVGSRFTRLRQRIFKFRNRS